MTRCVRSSARNVAQGVRSCRPSGAGRPTPPRGDAPALFEPERGVTLGRVMSHPSDLSDPSSKDPPGSGARELTADDFERLAAVFRPSWELDEAPFSGPANLSAAEVESLQARGVASRVLGTVPTTNGSHAHAEQVAPSVVITEPPEPVPVQPASPPPARSPAQPQPRSVELRMATPAHAQALPTGRPAESSLARPRLPSLEFDELPAFARRSKKPLWIALSTVAIALASFGAWVLAGSSGQPRYPAENVAPAPPKAITTAVETAARPAPEPAPPPPPAASPPPPLPTPVAAPASPPQPAAARTPATPPKPPLPAPKAPPSRPKAGGPTIVRDVPF